MNHKNFRSLFFYENDSRARQAELDYPFIVQEYADFQAEVKENRRRYASLGVNRILSPQGSQLVPNMAAVPSTSGSSSSSTASKATPPDLVPDSEGTSSGSTTSSTRIPEAEEAMQLQEPQLSRPTKRQRRRGPSSVPRELPGGEETSSCDSVSDEGPFGYIYESESGTPYLIGGFEHPPQDYVTSPSGSDTGEDGATSGGDNPSGDEPEDCEGHASLRGSDQDCPEESYNDEEEATAVLSRCFHGVGRRSLGSIDTYTRPYWSQQYGQDSFGQSTPTRSTLLHARRSAARLHAANFQWDNFRRGQLQAHPSRGTDPRNRCQGGPYCPLPVCSGFPSRRYIAYNHNQLGSD